MSSSTFTNAYLVDFESVLNIPNNEGMQNMFKALESSGLRGFLGCKSVLYEPELEHFFDTALIQGGDITGVISGKYFSISPSRFAGVFELPTEGLSDFSDVPKNLVSDARKIFSKYGSITVKAGSYDAVTTERFQMMTTIHFGLKVNWTSHALTMGEATPFPSSKILSPKTVLTYITTNQIADTRGQSDEGGKTPVAIVKRASKSKKKSEYTSDAPVEIVLEVAGSKKRPATEGSDPVVPKKRRTVKTKHSPSQENLDIVNIPQDVVPLQIVDPTPTAAAIKSPAPKRISRKRRLILPTGSDDESWRRLWIWELVRKRKEDSVLMKRRLQMILNLVQAVGSKQVGEEHMSIDDLLMQISEDMMLPSVTTAEITKISCEKVGEEHMSIDDLLMQISEDMMLPSVTTAEITKIRFGGSIHIPGVQERDLYYASLPLISIHDKWKAILEEDEPVTGNPARETVELICGDVDFLVQLRDQGVTAGADSLEIRRAINAVDAKMLSLDGQVAAIRNEQLEFQTKIAADILSHSTQLGDLVEYIRGGYAKKGEGSSSRRPLPTPVHQSEGTGDVVRLTEPTQTDIDAAQRDIFERMARADRERDRERRERRLSRSGAYKRRRGH
ncbi:hypothetical protein F511_42320 [Dorcoceras hygrometricum]|uniref:Mucin-2-like n=1 Tax=Dorcoceras hygrometricum TaxID=472368 RepID=A0A2Z7D4X8_9LAMI|nr:hypothetical protein F511_42320 [Dorcoceras hygrometricum]